VLFDNSLQWRQCGAFFISFLCASRTELMSPSYGENGLLKHFWSTVSKYTFFFNSSVHITVLAPKEEPVNIVKTKSEKKAGGGGVGGKRK
jgi:hypothetical protein